MKKTTSPDADATPSADAETSALRRARTESLLGLAPVLPDTEPSAGPMEGIFLDLVAELRPGALFRHGLPDATPPRPITTPVVAIPPPFTPQAAREALDAALQTVAPTGTLALQLTAQQPPELDPWTTAFERADILLLTLAGPAADLSSDSCGATLEALANAGFQPVLQLRAGAEPRLDVLALRRASDRYPALRSAVLTVTEAARPMAAPALAEDAPSPRNVPVLIPCYNNPTHCRQMVDQLRARGFASVTLVDNASTSPAMHEMLAKLESEGVTIDRLTENLGPRLSIFSPERLRTLPRRFIVSDPDILLRSELPEDFVRVLADLLEKHRLPKAGLALDISQPRDLREDKLRIGRSNPGIVEWERRFWRNPVGQTPTGDLVFRARVDTTFALYDQHWFKMKKFMRGLRVAGRYTAVHTPWLKTPSMPAEEEARYRASQKFSFHLRQTAK